MIFRAGGSAASCARLGGDQASLGAFSRERGMKMLKLLTRFLLVLFAATVAAPVSGQPFRAKVHTYFVAADEIDWDYVPAGKDMMHGHPLQKTVTYTKAGKQQMPTVYRKSVYREYTDATFKTLKPRSDRWRHLGMLGPVIRAEVGDTIRVVFRNNGTHPYSIHAHGVFYDKDSEGSPYEDGTGGKNKADDAVAPGAQHTYVWRVPERAGPGPNDLSSVMWAYHSHTDEIRDVNGGLIGTMIITRRGMSRADGTPKDVDREFVTLFGEFREDQTHFVERNLPLVHAGDRAGAPEGVLGSSFYQVFSMNGFLHGNLPLEWMTMKKGERVRWYTFASTADFDFHTPHWHGNTVLVDGKRLDLTVLSPLQTMVADMRPDNVGVWMYHCHVSNHMAGGMMQRFQVVVK